LSRHVGGGGSSAHIIARCSIILKTNPQPQATIYEMVTAGITGNSTSCQPTAVHGFQDVYDFSQ